MVAPPPAASAARSEAAREPRGYTPLYGMASFGLFMAILTPVLGGLSLKIQTLTNGDLTQAAAQLSLVTGVGALFALVAQPLVGRLSDRTTSRLGMRKPWIIVGVVGAAIGLIAIGLAPNIWVVLIAWCFTQTLSNFAQAAETATIPDQVPVPRRGFVSGVVGATTPLAILAGAVALAVFSSDVPKFAVPAVIGLVLGLLFALTLRDRVLRVKPAGRLSARDFFASFVFNPKAHPNLGWAWLTKFLVMFGFAAVQSYLTLFLGAKFAMNKEQQAQFNMIAQVVLVTFMVISSLVGGRLSDRLGRRRAFVTAGGITMAVGLAILAVSPLFGMSAGKAVIIVAAVVVGTGGGMFTAVDMALCTEVLPKAEDTAKDLGVLNIANALPQSLAPLFAGTVIVAFGSAGYTVWFLIGAVVALTGGLLVYRIKGVA